MAEGQEYAPPGPDDIIDAAVAVNPNPIQFQSYADAASALGTNAEETQGPDHVFQILEDAVPRPDETTLLSPEEQTRRRELVDQTWDQVRRWLYAHEGQEDRAAAAMIRGQGDATILHLMCRMSNPPPDIISDIIDAAPDVVSWPDTHGWLPLHHACAYGASPEVYEILTQTYPESKLAQDNQNRTPLHFYATRNSDNPAAAAAMADTVHLLADTGAAELPDRGGMLPMHYACAYGTSPAVLKVLADCYPESFTIKENNGRTPMHLAMVNAHRDASPGVIKFLLDEEGKTTVDMRDHEGNLPLHLLALGLRGLNYDEQDKLNNVAECLKLYLAAEPVAPPDFLTALQDLPDWLQDVAVVSPHVRSILNKKIVQRFPTSFLMLDGYFLIFLIVFFEITTTDHIKVLFDEDADIKQTWNERTFEIICLFIGAGYFLGRELIQIISLISLGSFSSWFADATNWLDMAVITMVLYYAILMTGLAPIGESEFRSGVAFTKGVLWMAVISFLKSTLVDFAVFVGGVFYVVQRLVAFLLAVGVILLAFAQMFFIVYRQHPVCQQNPISDVEYEEEFGFEPCNFPHCSFEESLLKVYTMMMGEIGDVTRYDRVLVAQLLYVGYAFLVVILLSNVLIAIVTDSYEIIQNDRAAIVFWSNRLDFVAEMDAISSVVKNKICSIGSGTRSGMAPGAPTAVQEGPNGTTIVSSDNRRSTKNWFREGWKQVMVLFESNFYYDMEMNPSNIEFYIYLVYRLFAVCIIIPVWIVAGILTAGWLWPPQIREYLFVQKETAASRAELERQKLEQLKEIQTDIKNLKTELRKEMANDREEMIRMKGEVEGVQGEVLSDLMQVKELMSTLLDLGGIQN